MSSVPNTTDIQSSRRAHCVSSIFIAQVSPNLEFSEENDGDQTQDHVELEGIQNVSAESWDLNKSSAKSEAKASLGVKNIPGAHQCCVPLLSTRETHCVLIMTGGMVDLLAKSTTDHKRFGM